MSSDNAISRRGGPLLLGNVIYTKGATVTGYYIEALNVPGALASIASVFAKYNINIVALNLTFSLKKGARGGLFIVADFTDSTITPETIRRELKKLEVVSDVEIAKPEYPNVIADTYHFPLCNHAGKRYILLPEDYIKYLVIGIRRKFGSGGLAFLYHEGSIVGEALVDEYKAWKIKTLRDALNLLLLRSRTLGRYIGEITYYSYGNPLRRDSIVIRVYNCWECEAARTHGVEGPASQFERGIIAGFIQAYTKRRVIVEETKCIAKGDNYCEFKVEFPS